MSCENGFVIFKLANLNQNSSCHLKKKTKTKQQNPLHQQLLRLKTTNFTSQNLIITNIITQCRLWYFLLDLWVSEIVSSHKELHGSLNVNNFHKIICAWNTWNKKGKKGKLLGLLWQLCSMSCCSLYKGVGAAVECVRSCSASCSGRYRTHWEKQGAVYLLVSGNIMLHPKCFMDQIHYDKPYS